MIFNEVAPQTPKNKVDKTIMVLSKVRGCRQIVGSLFCLLTNYRRLNII